MTRNLNPRILVLASAMVLALEGCAHGPDSAPAVCDGHHRRPANPYGSVLPAFPDPSAPAPKEGAPPPVTTRPAPNPQSFHPCGGRP